MMRRSVFMLVLSSEDSALPHEEGIQCAHVHTGEGFIEKPAVSGRWVLSAADRLDQGTAAEYAILRRRFI